MHQLPLPHPTADRGPVVCLGRTFASDDARRAHFTELLRARLQDPAFRAGEGFPLGTDEAILALSDPPYYTACPNPWLGEMIAEWAEIRNYELRITNEESASEIRHSSFVIRNYHREPFAADVSEGKNDPIYNAHSYHTKVPHKAIMRYILHYTEPGDVVFDGFCGTGMTGVAAQLCGDRRAVTELGYRVDGEGVVWDGDKAISRLGARRAVLNDLSPAATFIAYNYNTPVDVAAFEREARRILDEVEAELGWMYETWHPHCDDPQRVKGKINYTVWSDVFVCPYCTFEIVLWDVAVNKESRRVSEYFSCPNCRSALTKSILERATVLAEETVDGNAVLQAKRVPVLIEYVVRKKRFEKAPDVEDLALLEKIKSVNNDSWFPDKRIDTDIDLWYERDYRSLGIYTVRAFYKPRSLLAVSSIWRRIKAVESRRLSNALTAWLQSVMMGFTLMNRYQPIQFGRIGGSQVNRVLSGTLYVGSLMSEVSPSYPLTGKIRRVGQMASGALKGHAALTTTSASSVSIPDSSVDYAFVDPPFGSNIIYSDLSIVWEAWLSLFTNTDDEAVVHRRKKRGSTMADYKAMMAKGFANIYRSLKPGRWLTVEFHNTQSVVWNNIQEAILQAGFVVADVRTLDKKQSSFKQVTASSAVKQDLVISAYKPNDGLEQRFLSHAGTAEGAWDFVRHHLGQLPVAVETEAGLEPVAERRDYLLFDRMVAFHIQRGAAVPLSAAEFYAGLRQRFDERDGMYFLHDQTPAYDAARLRAGRPAQLALFVSDEKSSRQWLRQQLDPALGGRPQTYQEIQPAFLRNLHQAAHEQLPELRDLLEDSFLPDEAGRWYAPDPNKAEDLERLRRRALLAEFAGYHSGRGKIKQFRSEAVRAGFADAYGRKEYATILRVAERLPERVVQEDPDLLMYYDAASLRA